ncbi:MAG: cytochrome P450 [Acidimicrobiaceae bacterium]|nr:cytochrome P450 [Acidimicrobiaceae bacterium]
MTRKITVDDFSSEEYKHNPFPIWRQMRDEQPLFYDSNEHRWILTRYTDVMAVLRDHERYSTRTYIERFRPIFGRTLAELDGARHIRERTIVAPAFVGKSLDGYEQFIRRSIERIGEKIFLQNNVDLVKSMTNILPSTVITALLGIPEKDDDFVFDIGNTILAAIGSTPEMIERGASAHRKFAEYLAPIISSRRDAPTTDLISRIVHAQADGQSLTDDEICSFISFLLVAGGPTTDTGIANFWWNLLSDPDQLEACRNDPTRISRAFSESLRRDGPIINEDRMTNCEIELYGITIPKDSIVVICLGSANTDDSVFAEPESFNPDRTDLFMGVERKGGIHENGVSGHMAFGMGSHFCMGYQLARREAEMATSQFLLQAPGVRLTSEVHPEARFFDRFVGKLPVEIGKK